MTNSTLLPTFALNGHLRRAAFTLVLIAATVIGMALTAQAQTLTVLHTFTGGTDGANPVGLAMDAAGNLYGTTSAGGLAGQCTGYGGCGVVFKVTRAGTGWTFGPIYSFTGGNDGSLPLSRVIFGPNGTLYGTTALDGADGTGVVFNLRPPARVTGRVFSPWTETVLYAFEGGAPDGNYPGGDLLFDAAGNIYGTTQAGGYECEDTVYCGVVYELTPHGSSWSESVLYAFTDESVAIPLAGVVADQAGNLYGTTSNDDGAVYELAHSGSGWTESAIHYFGGTGDGAFVSSAGVMFDPSGHLYGTTEYGGTNNGGIVFELSSSGGSWTETVPYSFSANSIPNSLFRDPAGNFYGVASGGGAHNQGWVFKLTSSGGTWTATDLYDFSGGPNGAVPGGNVIVDAQGNVYGTTLQGGGSGCFGEGCGVVWKLTP